MILPVLLVDDDPAVGTVLGALLEQAGIPARSVLSAEQALKALEARPFGAVVTDVRMPGMDGLALLEEVHARWPGLAVVVLTAHGTISMAIQALKGGAADFLLKPFDREEVLFIVRKALAASATSAANVPPAPSAGGAILGASDAMRQLQAMIRRIAPGTATILLQGETGTGKNLVAKAIHHASARRGGPFVTVQCASLPDNLLESELFGYERGAFTGAVAAKPGRVELADGGTLFLDEIGDVSPALQVRLLRLLQDREYERLGATLTRAANVRFVAATHRNLAARVADGSFREDLYFRLHVIPLMVPPLRERREDVAVLAQHFCRFYGQQNGRPAARFGPRALERLAAEDWPGNVRQLQNLVERLVVLADEDVLTEGHLVAEAERSRCFAATAVPVGASDTRDESLGKQRRAAERQAVQEALRRSNDNRTQAARLLGVSRRTLYNKLAELGIE